MKLSLSGYPCHDANSPARWRGSTVGSLRRCVSHRSLLISLGAVSRLAGSKRYPTFLPRNHQLRREWKDKMNYGTVTQQANLISFPITNASIR